MPRFFLLWITVFALSTATQAQNLDVGKSDAEIFNANCGSCHRSPREFVKNRSAPALRDFLRRHYTASAASAATLAEYLTSGVSKPGSSSVESVGQSARAPHAAPSHPPQAATGANPPSRPKRSPANRWQDPKEELWPGCPDAYSCFPLYGGYGP